MTIKIFPSQLPGRPLETHEWSGSIAGFFEAQGIDTSAQDEQPVSVAVNGEPCPPATWRDTWVTDADDVEIRVIPRGWGELVYALVALVVSYAMRPKVSSAPNLQQGRQLETSSATGNVAKLNQVVPELFGRFKRYPDYLVPPRNSFSPSNPRTQNLDMLLCVGPGHYDIDPNSVMIGNTPLMQIPGAVLKIYGPGADLTGDPNYLNWYSAPEIGPTKAGTAGLEMTSVVPANINPTGSTYTLAGDSITSDTPFPDAWGAMTTITLLAKQSVTVANYTDNNDVVWNMFEGDFSEFGPEIGMEVTCWGALDGQYRISQMAGTGQAIGLAQYGGTGGDGMPIYRPVGDLPPGDYELAITRVGRSYQVQGISGNTITLALSGGGAWSGFAARTITADRTQWGVDSSSVYGEMAGPFVICPPSERTRTFEIDFFFSQGLSFVSDDGGVYSMFVRVEIQYRDFGTTNWQTWRTVYSNATLDQIGYTARIITDSPIRPEVRVRRYGANSPSAQIHDEIQWYGARCVLLTRPRYPNWTVISVSVSGLGKIAADTQNLVSLTATRKLPTLDSMNVPVPTRDISAAVMYVAKTVGYDTNSIDMDELWRLQQIWNARGETMDHVFDETTAQAALEACLLAGMAELTIDDGKLKPVRDDVRTVLEQSYSSQNTTGGIVRAFAMPRQDDNDGCQVQYVDEDDSWSQQTIDCILPGSLGLKLEKLKLSGVTSKERAWRIGMRRAREQRYRRWTYTFTTELDALNSGYGSYVAVYDDIPGQVRSSILMDVTGTAPTLTLRVSEPLEWTDGQVHRISWRRPDGTVTAGFLATRGRDEFSVVAHSVPPEDVPVVTLSQEPPHVYFGVSRPHAYEALVTQISPDGDAGTVKVTAVNYDSRVYADDNNSPR